jgi:hypothetical protein
MSWNSRIQKKLLAERLLPGLKRTAIADCDLRVIGAPQIVEEVTVADRSHRSTGLRAAQYATPSRRRASPEQIQ